MSTSYHPTLPAKIKETRRYLWVKILRREFGISAERAEAIIEKMLTAKGAPRRRHSHDLLSMKVGEVQRYEVADGHAASVRTAAVRYKKQGRAEFETGIDYRDPAYIWFRRVK